jgi:hypothetical protein
MRMARRLKTKKSMVGVAISAAAIIATLSAGAALAGEEHAQGASWCRYSGQNDDPDAAAPEGGRVQSYGQLVRQGLKATEPSPGVACNPVRTFLPPLR